MNRLSITFTLTLVLAAAGCGFGATAQQLRARAAFDLDCAESQLTLVEIDAKTRGVRGCGQRATYVEMCKPCANGYVGCECTWILNGDTTRGNADGAPSPAPAESTEAG